jgi:hypothetical protein
MLCFVCFLQKGNKRSRVTTRSKKRKNDGDGDEGNVRKKRKDTGVNYAVRCSMLEHQQIVVAMSDDQKRRLTKLGWGFVLEYKVKTNVRRPLIFFLMERFSEDMVVYMPDGNNLHVTATAVEAFFGFPNGTMAAPRPSSDGNTEPLKWLKTELELRGIEVKGDVTVATHLKALIKQGAADDFSMKCIFLAIFKNLMVPGLSTRIDRQARMVQYLDIENAKNMNYCDLVVTELKSAVRKFHAEGANKNQVEGCCVLAMFMHLDSIDCPHAVSTSRLLCCIFWMTKF